VRLLYFLRKLPGLALGAPANLIAAMVARAWADTLFANQQDEGRGLGDLTGKLREPQASGPQAFRRRCIISANLLFRR
jgi:hypothetical protein